MKPNQKKIKKKTKPTPIKKKQKKIVKKKIKQIKPIPKKVKKPTAPKVKKLKKRTEPIKISPSKKKLKVEKKKSMPKKKQLPPPKKIVPKSIIKKINKTKQIKKKPIKQIKKNLPKVTKEKINKIKKKSGQKTKNSIKPKVIKKNKKAPPPMFGISLSSTIKGNKSGGVSIKAGNTLITKNIYIEGDVQNDFDYDNVDDTNVTMEEQIYSDQKLKKKNPLNNIEVLENLSEPVEQVDEMPLLLKELKAEYSEEAKLNRIEGSVLLELLIDTNGDVKKVIILKGLGYGLDEAAQKAAMGFLFSPSKMDGILIPVRLEYAITFILQN